MVASYYYYNPSSDLLLFLPTEPQKSPGNSSGLGFRGSNITESALCVKSIGFATYGGLGLFYDERVLCVWKKYGSVVF